MRNTHKGYLAKFRGSTLLIFHKRILHSFSLQKYYVLTNSIIFTSYQCDLL